MPLKTYWTMILSQHQAKDPQSAALREAKDSRSANAIRIRVMDHNFEPIRVVVVDKDGNIISDFAQS